ncbi:hypothetical protein PoB_004394800 [Plakobranchus ocellatus]|uniref:Uncharacterized protein n=1 Tax=Plakobranchus ocellatus TaxID=259542 RepID=A0AAV4BF17_9GAST|nr:hypothetical protein PoB_004394800 [Plakobranchus ocellatus]
MDVSALHTSTRERYRSLQICSTERERSGIRPISFLCNLIQVILICNYFRFSNVMWLQTHGTAMGTCMAPSYANLFMGDIEEKILVASADKPMI